MKRKSQEELKHMVYDICADIMKLASEGNLGSFGYVLERTDNSEGCEMQPGYIVLEKAMPGALKLGAEKLHQLLVERDEEADKAKKPFLDAIEKAMETVLDRTVAGGEVTPRDMHKILVHMFDTDEQRSKFIENNIATKADLPKTHEEFARQIRVWATDNGIKLANASLPTAYAQLETAKDSGPSIAEMKAAIDEIVNNNKGDEPSQLQEKIRAGLEAKFGGTASIITVN